MKKILLIISFCFLPTLLHAGTFRDIFSLDKLFDLPRARTLSIDAKITSYNNTESGVTADNVQKALDGLFSSVSADIFGDEYQLMEVIPTASTSDTDFVEVASMITTDLPSGIYRIGWYYEWSGDNPAKEIDVRIQVNNSATTNDIHNNLQEPKDNDITHRQPISGFSPAMSLAGIHIIDLDFRSTSNSATVYIRNVRIELWRVKI